MPQDNGINYEVDSVLGQDPKCDICEKPVVEGQKVKQMFIGTVKLYHPDGELGLVESSYYLVHTDCEKKVN